MRTLTADSRESLILRFGLEVTEAALSPHGVGHAVYRPEKKVLIIVGVPDPKIENPSRFEPLTHGLVFSAPIKYYRKIAGDPHNGQQTFLAVAESGYMPPDVRLDAVRSRLRGREVQIVRSQISHQAFEAAAVTELSNLQDVLNRILKEVNLTTKGTPSITIGDAGNGRFVLTVRLTGELPKIETTPPAAVSSTTPNDQHN